MTPLPDRQPAETPRPDSPATHRAPRRRGPGSRGLRRRLPWLPVATVAGIVGLLAGSLIGRGYDAGSPPSASPLPATATDPAPHQPSASHAETQGTQTTAASPSASAAPTVQAPQGFLTTAGAQIVDSHGNPVVIRGINWFGMETETCAPHGLWQRSLDSLMDQVAALGFTTIRLPFANECLHATAVSGIDASVNADLVDLTPLEMMDRVVAEAAERDLTVILDRHRPSIAGQSELWYTAEYPESAWISDWVALAQRYRDDPTVIGADLHNEPHGAACWACDDESRDWPAAAERAGDSILAVHPGWLIIVEGVETMQDGTTTWWGAGLSDAGDHPVTLSAPDQLVYSVHEYPQTVYHQAWFDDPAYPDNLVPLWTRNWGYLIDDGIAPVFVGELGTRYEDPQDQVWLSSLVDYLASGQVSWAYWSLNPNSADTGGILDDDWQNVHTDKLEALAPLLTH